MHSLHPWTWMPASACMRRGLRLPRQVVGRGRTRECCGLLAAGFASVGDRSLARFGSVSMRLGSLGRMRPAGWCKHPWCCCGGSCAVQRSSGGSCKRCDSLKALLVLKALRRARWAGVPLAATMRMCSQSGCGRRCLYTLLSAAKGERT